MDVDPDGATWRKSSYSNGTGGECVEVAGLPNGRVVRDSKHPEGPILAFTREGWQAFASRFTPQGQGCPPGLRIRGGTRPPGCPPTPSTGT